ncbi:MAG: argininosuccinate lyase [Desulfobacterota bacterium]|nr:argininosuccinate lyase [Thermodesulfobacteriota bacterium]
MAKKLWSGCFNEQTDAAVDAFTASLPFDYRLYRYDIQGSIAHCRMLARQRIISRTEARRIIAGLREIEQEITQGRLPLRQDCEDIHMLIESRLIEKIGPVGGKLHTGRSRNDQIALDISLYLRDVIKTVDRHIHTVQRQLLAAARQNIDVILPGFTHLQHAQPVLLAHHLMAYIEMLFRDRERLAACYTRANRMPLGAGALAGTPHPIDRRYVAQLLGYPAITSNSMDTVSDRDVSVEFCSAAAIIMMHLSRLCEELVLWSSPEFQFVRIGDAFCTGSSIMPQKKNPDVPELIRGKTGRVYGNVIALLTLLKGLPLTYNRDLQEDKPPLFDSADTVIQCLDILARMLPHITFNRERMEQACRIGFLTATDLADYLAAAGMPFRAAHELTGKIVSYCIKHKKQLDELSLDELRAFSPKITRAVIARLTPAASVQSRTSDGGTALKQVRAAITRATKRLSRYGQFTEQ